MRKARIKKSKTQMISRKWLFAILVSVSQSACAKSYELCDQSKLEKVDSGWLRTLDVNGVKYIDFITSKNELEKGEPPLPKDMVMAFARDAAIQEFYRFYEKLTPKPWKKADLGYSHLESFAGQCLAETLYGFRLPIASMNWIEPHEDVNDPSMAPVKELLKKYESE